MFNLPHCAPPPLPPCRYNISKVCIELNKQILEKQAETLWGGGLEVVQYKISKKNRDIGINDVAFKHHRDIGNFVLATKFKHEEPLKATKATVKFPRVCFHCDLRKAFKSFIFVSFFFSCPIVLSSSSPQGRPYPIRVPVVLAYSNQRLCSAVG